MKSVERLMRPLFFARHSFGILFPDDKDTQSNYDVLITDIDSDDLSGEISKSLGKNNLSALSSDEKEFEKIRYGIVYGRFSRGIVSLPTRFQNKSPIWVHYLVDTGSPWTFLSKESL